MAGAATTTKVPAGRHPPSPPPRLTMLLAAGQRGSCGGAFPGSCSFVEGKGRAPPHPDPPTLGSTHGPTPATALPPSPPAPGAGSSPARREGAAPSSRCPLGGAPGPAADGPLG